MSRSWLCPLPHPENFPTQHFRVKPFGDHYEHLWVQGKQHGSIVVWFYSKNRELPFFFKAIKQAFDVFSLSSLLGAAGICCAGSDGQQVFWQALQPMGAFLPHSSVATLQMANWVWFEECKYPRCRERRSWQGKQSKKTTNNARI